MVFGEAPRSFMEPYRSSRCFGVSLESRTFPRAGRMVCSIWARYVRIVVGDNSRRSHSTNQRSSSWPKVVAEAVLATLAELVHQVALGVISGSSTAVERSRDLTSRTLGRVYTHVDPQLPDALPLLPLRTL